MTLLYVAGFVVLLLAFCCGILFGVFIVKESDDEPHSWPIGPQKSRDLEWPRPVDFPPKK